MAVFTGLGLVGAPSITFSADTNTGIFSPGADTLALVTAGANRLHITSGGLLGLGTSSVSQKLQIAAGNVQIDSNYGFLWDNSTTGIFGNGSPSVLQFYTGNAERMRVTSTGVGIGTTAPLTKLEVRSGVITAGSVDAPNGAEILRGYYGSSGALTVIGSEYSSGGPVIGCGVKPSTSASSAFLSSTSEVLARGAYTIEGNIHKWYIGAAQTVAENSAVVTSEAMRIDTSGRLLVGTSSNSGGALLQVNGNRIRIATANTPASAGATGTTGEIAWDANYIYVCTATNTWKRTAISTW